MVTDNTNQADDTTAFLRAARSGNLEKVVEYLDTDLDINTANSNGLNALHLASKDGHVEIVTELLKRGAHVDAATKKGNTALHIASLAGQAEIVNILLQYGSTVNIQSQNGFTPLYMAAQENHDQVVKILLCNGANQSLATEDGFTPLAVAMQQGHDKVVSVLLENDSKGKVRLPALHIAAKKDDCKAADLLLQNDHKPDVTSKSGFTPLHIAAHYGNEEIARLLIKRGADVNYLAKHNISPLHVAAKWGKNNMVKILLENSATIDSKTRDGLTPLHCAARSGHDQVVAVLLENSAPISARTKNGLAPLHMASQGDHVDAARVLLYHRAPVDEVTIDYLTSLHVAAHCGHVRVAKLLLDRKADPNARALNGFTPLHIACKKNRIKVVELLVKHGASIESTTESGLTPLHVASFMGCMNIVIFLLQHEANPDVPTVRGETPLHLAARANQTDIIRILLRNGAKVDARAREQQTPLHVASRLGNVDIVMLLLQHGAEVDTATKDMYTALHIAAKEGQEEVAAILVENNASLKATTKNGFTPLHIAAKYGNINVAKILLQKDNALDAKGKNEITALHLACHYDHSGVAGLLLERGASPLVTSQNGHTPLHVAARKNQMEIASTLLDHGAEANAESKAGFTPLHLSAQKGHHDMTNLLIEHGADPNHKSKNGLTALHLCAQEDFVKVASILVKNGANVESRTETGYRPIHVASHFGNPSMVRFLIKQNAEVDVKTNQDYTPLHQAAQQGHAHVASALLDGNASHGARTNDGLTALNIAQKLGYISVIEVLKGLTYDNLAPCNKNWEEKYKVVAPESLQEASLMSDSDDEGGSDILVSEQPYRYLTADLMKSLRDDSLPIDVTRDDPIHRQVSNEDRQEFVQSNNYCSAENFEMHDSTTLGFLVSFLVDARGGAMKGCRHSGVRIVVPPRRATMPIRVTCRLVKATKTTNPPPLMEGEALATRIVEMGPVGATFLGPVLIDVPHFASARGNEREIIILRSENGESWKEHDNALDNDDTLAGTPHDPQMSASYSGRITRIITTDFPQYFAIITRIKQEVHVIGSEGGILISSVVNHVQAVFPPGALTKKIKVGLQAHLVPHELTAKLLGNCVAVSPVITIEPRRRKFHKPITLTIPVPQAANKGMINQYGGETPTLRLLCSIAGGTSEAQWEDVTGSTPLTFMNDRVSFTTTVSARFWLMDCRNVVEVPKMATELYRESLFVPFVTNFVIYSKRMDLLEATLRILCMTDGKEGPHTLEKQEEFLEIVKSRDVEALDGKDLYIEFSGNLTPVTKSGVQLKFTFKAFRQNRLSFHAKVKDPLLDPVARMLFMREPRVAKGEPSQQPICILNIVLPELVARKKGQGKIENDSDYEDSNIISQKMDSYASEYEIDGREKSDYPKVVIPSPSSERKELAAAEVGDAAIIQESLAQKVACPPKTVDASYSKNRIDAEEGSMYRGGVEAGEEEEEEEEEESPEVVEKQTYSEKLKFWEEITGKKEAANVEQQPLTDPLRSLTESATGDQETYGEEETPAVEEEEEEEEIEMPDISECSVAEKAHYFEEQIQKESVPPGSVKTGQLSKTSSESDNSSKVSDKDVSKTTTSGLRKNEERGAATDTDDSLSIDSGVTPRRSVEIQVAKNTSDQLKTAPTEVCQILSVDEKVPEEKSVENESAIKDSLPSVTNGVAKMIEDGSALSFVTGIGSTTSGSVIKICRNFLDDERKVASEPISALAKSVDRVDVDVGVKKISDMGASKEVEIRDEENFVEKVSKMREKFVSTVEKDVKKTCGAFLDNEIAIAESQGQGQDQGQAIRVNVDAMKKEFESRIPKHVGTPKVEKSVTSRVAKSKDSQIPVPIEEKISTVSEAQVKAAETPAPGKRTESRIPVRTNDQTQRGGTADEIPVRRYESGLQARAEIIGELKERFEAAAPASEDREDREPSPGTWEDSGKRIESKTSTRSVRESCREEISSSGIAIASSNRTGGGNFPSRSGGEGFDDFFSQRISSGGGMDEPPRTFASVKSTVDHRVEARREERETSSSEVTNSEGKRVSLEVAEKARAEEMKSEKRESRLVEESPTQRIEESQRDRRESERKSAIDTCVKLLDEGKILEAEALAAESNLNAAERATFKSREDRDGYKSDETSVKVIRGRVVLAGFEMRADLSVDEEEEKEEKDQEQEEEEEEEDKLTKESEARAIAETIIRSIETEIESRAILPPLKDPEDLRSPTRVPTSGIVELPFDEESKRGSISVTEDLTRDEESSPRCSLPFDHSSTRVHQDRDMTISPSTASDRTEMEESMEADSNESSEGRNKLPLDQEKPQPILLPGEIKATLLSRKESFDELACRDAATIQKISGARVLEIIEPAETEVEKNTERIFSDVVVIPEKEEILSLGDSAIEKKSDLVLEGKIDVLEDDGGPPLVSPRTKIQSLDIKPVNWMIGDEKIEISESLQPSQVFNQELEEYESVVKRMEEEEDEDAEPAAPKSIIAKSKFTVIPVSDKQLESELVENNLDVSCQELMDTLQKEFDAKTPTDNFVVETMNSELWNNEKGGVIFSEDKSVQDEADVSASVGQKRKEEVEISTMRLEPAVEEKEEEEGEEEKKQDEKKEELKDEEKETKSVATERRSSGRSATKGEEQAPVERHRRTDHSKGHHDSVASTKAAKKESEATSLDLSSRYAITVLDQVVKKEIAEVKESLEAAKQDLIEELSENSETVFQIKDSPSEFQFKLQPEAIPNELPFLYTRERQQPETDDPKSEDLGTASPIAKPRNTREESETELGAETEEPKPKDEEPATMKEGVSSGEETVATIAAEVPPVVDTEDSVSAPVPASRSSSDAEVRDERFLMCPPQPAPRRRQKPSRSNKKIKSDSETELGSSSGESNYHSVDYETGSGSRPSSSDIEAMQSGMPSGTASEYETALMSAENSSASRLTSQDYHTAISSLSSRESIKSIYSESSGHLASIESSSEMSETLVPSEEDAERDNLDENIDNLMEEEEELVTVDAPSISKASYSSDSDNVPLAGAILGEEELDGEGIVAPSRMKRSSEMIFQQEDEADIEGLRVTADRGEVEEKESVDDVKRVKGIDNGTSTLPIDPTELRSVDLTTSRVEEDGVQSVCTQVTSRSREEEEAKPIGDAVEKLADDDSIPQGAIPEPGVEVEEAAERPDPNSVQGTSMSASSTSAMSLETVIDSKERRSPDSDSFELVDKPDIIDDFVVIEEVGREAEEFDSEGKSIHIGGGMSGAMSISGKNYDTEVENLITGSGKDAERARSAGLQASRNNDLFDFESEESPPQVSNEEGLYSQSYSDDEQYEGGKKWVEMQFQTDARGYEIDYDRGPLEDIKEEEITDFEAGSSRFGSLGSHKESVGSLGSVRGSLGSTPEYDVLAGRKYFTKPSEHDNLSLSSLQEFESLESAVAMENARRALCGSQDSINNGSLPKRYVTSRSGHGDDVSLSSLKDFEGLETACREAHMIELRAREEEDLLDHESPENRYKLESLARAKAEASAPASFNPSTSGSDDYEKRIREIDEIIRIAQSNVEKFDRQDDTADDISQIEITEADCRSAAFGQDKTAGNHQSSQIFTTQARIKETNVMETSTDSLELDEQEIDKKCDPLCRSSDSLEMKTTLDLPSLSSDSLNNVRDSKEQRHERGAAGVEQFDNGCRRISSDSLEIPISERADGGTVGDGKSSCDDRTERSVERQLVSSNDHPDVSRDKIGSENTSSNNGT